MAKKFIIAVDVDGVLADSIKQMLRIIEEETGVKKTEEEIKHYDLSDIGLPREYIMYAFRKAWMEYEKIKLVDPNIPYILKKLHEQAIIYIVTSSIGADNEIIGWLEMNNIVYDKLVHVKKDNEKLSVEADVFIEDNPYLAIELDKVGKSVIVLQRPWNGVLQEPWIKFKNNGITFAVNWSELFGILNEKLVGSS
ncbi:MAG: hypothetical protein RXO35_00110 [Candidatus Micrarchaeota archaeon]